MEIIEDCIARGLSCQDLWELWLHRHRSGTSPGATSPQGSSRTWLCHSLESGQQWDGEIAARGTKRKSQVFVAPVNPSFQALFCLFTHRMFCSFAAASVGKSQIPSKRGAVLCQWLQQSWTFAGCVLDQQLFPELLKQICELRAASPACPDLVPVLGPAGSSALLWINPAPAELFQSCFHQHSHIWNGTSFRAMLPFTFVFCSLWLPLVALLQQFWQHWGANDFRRSYFM